MGFSRGGVDRVWWGWGRIVWCGRVGRGVVR